MGEVPIARAFRMTSALSIHSEWLGATRTTNTSDIGRASVAQWIECSTNDRKVPNPTSDTRVFSSVFNPPSLVVVPRTTVKLN